jgi:hypothetical protein
VTQSERNTWNYHFHFHIVTIRKCTHITKCSQRFREDCGNPGSRDEGFMVRKIHVMVFWVVTPCTDVVFWVVTPCTDVVFWVVTSCNDVVFWVVTSCSDVVFWVDTVY